MIVQTEHTSGRSISCHFAENNIVTVFQRYIDSQVAMSQIMNLR